MDSGRLVVLAVLCALVCAALAAVLAWSTLTTARARRELVAVRAQLESVERRLEVASGPGTLPAPSTAAPDQEFVITTVGDAAVPALAAVPGPVSGREFASVAVGESLVTLVALGHGVRRALAAESRDRIGAAVRREVRRSRKERRRELKEARRTLRSERPSHRPDVQPDIRGDAA